MSDNDVILRIYASRLQGLSPYKRDKDLQSYLRGLKNWLKLNFWRSHLKTIRSLEHPNRIQMWKLQQIVRDTLMDDELFKLYSGQIIWALSALIKSLSDAEVNQLADAILQS